MVAIVENLATMSEIMKLVVANRRKRLRQWIDEHYGSQAAFLRVHDMNQSELSGLLREKTFKEDKARNIEELAGMPPFYLDQGINIAVTELSVNGARLVRVKERRIPVISNKEAITWSTDFNDKDLSKYETVVYTDAIADNAYALIMVGDTMTAPAGQSIPDGSIMYVDPNVAAEHGDIVVIHDKAMGNVLIKKLVVDGPNRYLSSLNPHYAPIKITEDYEIIGVVIECFARTYQKNRK